MEEIEDEFYCGETEEVIKKINFTEEYKELMKSLTGGIPKPNVVTDSEFCEIWERHERLLQVTTQLEGRMTTIEVIQRVYELRSKGVRLKLMAV